MNASARDIDRRSTFQKPGIWLVLILLAAFILRSVYLDWKPAHFDEGINGNFVRDMWRDGFYRYNPENFHGPLYFYILQFAELLLGSSVFAYRFVTGLISLAGVYLLFEHRRFFGTAAVWAALALALSTASVFYSRYAIHESLFVLCQIAFSFGYFLWVEERSRRSLAFMMAGFFASIAVKETFFIFFITWAIAIQCSRAWGRLRREAKVEREEIDPGRELGFWRKRAGMNDVILGVSLGVWFLLLVFTGGFLNSKGFRDMFLAFAFWTKTGTGPSGHEKPFFYWIDLLWRYEWPALIGLALSLPMILFSSRESRVVLFTAFGTWLAYSLIPYKTPWLILNLLWPLVLAAGLAASEMTKSFRKIPVVALIIAIPVSTATMFRLNFKDFVSEREPYVYVQTTSLMKVVLDIIFACVKARPEDLNMRLGVLVRDPWPLPWLLGGFPGLYYGRGQDADVKGADVILIDGANQAAIESKIQGKYWRIAFKIRDSYEGGFAYLDFEKFKGYVPSDSAMVEGLVAPAESASATKVAPGPATQGGDK